VEPRKDPPRIESDRRTSIVAVTANRAAVAVTAAGDKRVFQKSSGLVPLHLALMHSVFSTVTFF
jgi:hypothetical protein